MSHITALALTVLLAGPVLLPALVRADTPAPATAVRPALPTPVLMVWTDPPEAVRAAAATLRAACEAWPKHAIPPAGADGSLAPRGEPPEARTCGSVLDPDEDRTAWMLLGGALGAGAAGLAVAAYAVASLLFRLAGTGLRRFAELVRDRWQDHRPRWQE